ncbi:conjugal transfer protein TraD, partial [Pseudogemmobacter sonorensis]|uniref:conjugal transfer protein TraD n=1 Tax=Pseudogemmobacter sonorensis TaxID=2989681 RepID=UPI0036972FF6
MDRAVPHRPGNNTAFSNLRNYPYRIINLRPGKDTTMRKPRDYDAELKALEDKARELKARKVQQLGELVIATGADSLTA